MYFSIRDRSFELFGWSRKYDRIKEYRGVLLERDFKSRKWSATFIKINLFANSCLFKVSIESLERQ